MCYTDTVERVQVMCWGVRNMALFDLLTVKSPSVEVIIGEEIIRSNVIENTDKNPNFDRPLVFRELVSRHWLHAQFVAVLSVFVNI